MRVIALSYIMTSIVAIFLFEPERLPPLAVWLAGFVLAVFIIAPLIKAIKL